MRNPKLKPSSKASQVWTRWVLPFAVLLLLPACSINVKKDSNGNDKNVDIETPLGGIHVDKSADVRDTGLSVYPGARLKPKPANGDGDTANVNISGRGYGLKVIAVEFQSDEIPAKIISYYRDQLKKYGPVMECHTAGRPDLSTNYGHDSRKSDALTCGSETGQDIELKVGTQSNQHIVSVKPDGKGSDFALVYVQMRGKDSTI